MYNFDLEADARIQVNNRLKNLGWKLDGPDKNVFFEQPKTDEEKKKLQGKRPDYVLYRKDSDEPLIVIETKKKGQNIDKALEQGLAYSKAIDAPIVYATDGVFCKAIHSKYEKTLLLNGEELDEFIRELLAIEYINKYEVNTISKKVQYCREELIKIFDEANNMLRVEGLRAGIERFSEFANILFLKLISEIEYDKELSGIEPTIEQAYRWDNIRNKSGNELLSYVNDTVLPYIGNKYGDNIFSPLSISNPTVLKRIIDKLDPLTLTDINSDVKGDAFEYFLKQSTASGNDLGEYFTPRHIVKTMVKLVNPQIGEKIYDPFCGTGGLLIESYKHIHNTMARTPDNYKKLRETTIYGNEITNTARITKMNMILAGDGHSNIKMQNSLAHPVEGKYDVVLTNMPYSQHTDYGNKYDINSNNGDSICVQHCIKAIRNVSGNGRMAIVVPEGFLFRKDLRKTREYLFSNCSLHTIISLPQGVFLPYTGVKTDILYCTNVKNSITKNKIWYFDVKNDGYSLDNHRRKLNMSNDLDTYLAHRNIEQQDKKDLLNIGFIQMDVDEVKKNNYILVGKRYCNDFLQDKSIKMLELGEFAHIYTGHTPSTKNINYWKNGNIPWMTLNDIRNSGRVIYRTEKYITQEALEKTSVKLLPENTVLLCCTASIGEYAITKIPITTNQQFNAIIIKNEYKDKILNKYLYYIIPKLVTELERLCSQTTVKYISVDTLKKLTVPIPSIEIQTKIVNNIENYEKIINSTKDIINNYHPNIIYDSNWERIKLKDICKFEGGIQPPKSNFIYSHKEGYIRLLQIRDYKNDNNAVYIPKTLKHKTCNANDIMIGRYGPPVFQILKGLSGAYNVALIKCVIDKSKIIEDWLYYFLKSENVQNHIIGLSTRARQSGINIKDLEELEIPLPNINKQKKIVEQINKEIESIDNIKMTIKIFERKIDETINYYLNDN